jgi:hypothetical protein
LLNNAFVQLDLGLGHLWNKFASSFQIEDLYKSSGHAALEFSASPFTTSSLQGGVNITALTWHEGLATYFFN